MIFIDENSQAIHKRATCKTESLPGLGDPEFVITWGSIVVFEPAQHNYQFGPLSFLGPPREGILHTDIAHGYRLCRLREDTFTLPSFACSAMVVGVGWRTRRGETYAADFGFGEEEDLIDAASV